jgi:hypothetical protein
VSPCRLEPVALPDGEVLVVDRGAVVAGDTGRAVGVDFHEAVRRGRVAALAGEPVEGDGLCDFVSRLEIERALEQQVGWHLREREREAR